MAERTVSTNAADTEVELTAVDLVALSVADENDAARDDARARATSPGRKTMWKLTLPTGLLLAAVAAGSALYTRDAGNDAAQRVAVAAPAPMPDWVAEPAEPPPPPEPAPEPVRFRNPFDKTEVFEFPPGTTKAEARDAVAQILLDRAAERRAADPKLRKKHVHK